MALLKAKQLNINDVANAVLTSIAANYANTFDELVDGVHTFSTGYNYPPLIQGIVVTFVNANSATIQWTDQLSAYSYNIYCHPKGDLLNTIILYNIPTPYVTIYDLMEDTIYEVTVTPNLSYY